MKVEDLRKTFSKGMVSTSDDIVVAVYSFNDGSFAQGIEKEPKESLVELIQKSDSITLQIDKGKSIKAIFHGVYNLGDMQINEVLAPEITTKQLEDMMYNTEIIDPYGLYDEFKNMDFNNEDHKAALMERLSEVSDEIMKNEGMPFRNQSKYLEMLDMIKTFSGKVLKNTEASPPDEYGSGDIEITFTSDDTPIVIHGEKKDTIEKLASMSSCVAAEGDVNDGIVGITFFV